MRCRRVRFCAIVGLLAAVAGCDDGTALPTVTTVESPPSTSTVLSVILDRGAALTTDAVVEIEVIAPTGETEVQLSTDPTFADATWTPLPGPETIELHDGGYQMVFARVRGDTSQPTMRTAVAGITFDRWYTEATASAGGGSHRVSWAGLVAPNVIQVRIETGRVDLGPEGQGVIGRPLDTAALDDASRYTFANTPLAISSVSRISRPIGTIESGTDSGPIVHDVFLTLDAPLPTQVEHTLDIGDDIEPFVFSIDPTRSTSPAVHVNQVGFDPADDGKFALISTWTGRSGGVDYPSSVAFSVIDVADGSVAFEAAAIDRAGGASPRDEMGKGDLTGAEVLEADFSQLSAPGRYRLCVDDLGCSAEFVIAETLWERVAANVARSAYHQRNGIALGQPFTSITRPRPFHPDDGVVFRRTDVGMLDSAETIGRDDRFDEYSVKATDETITTAWGGHFDAGDWNSRIEHLGYLMTALDLVELFPERWANVDLLIPESANGIPDVIDEGLWDLDLYRRLQSPDGGIPGGVDQGRFSDDTETSWDNSVEVYVYRPDVWSSYIYAAAAARTAFVLQAYDDVAAALYRDSATKAMEWAEARLDTIDSAGTEAVGIVRARRAVAAAAMLQLTADRRWNSVFLESTDLVDAPRDLLDCDGPVCSAAWLYARIDPALLDPVARENAIESFRRTADALLEAQDTTAFAWMTERPDLPIEWGLGPAIPHGVGMLRAFVLTGNPDYRTAMVRAASFSLGGNQFNTSFATGLGSDAARWPLLVDTRHSGLAVAPGLFQYGPHNLAADDGDDWIDDFYLGPSGATPATWELPLLWSWFDVGLFPQMNEFTYTQGHATALWTFGVLAAT
jgi:endoglucanase